jgi:hypothetical protein
MKLPIKIIRSVRSDLNNFLGRKIVRYLDIDKHGLSFTVDAAVDMFDNAELDCRTGLTRRLDKSILAFKKSDTLFLLGSGPSIADIDVETWEAMSQFDSIGFNYSLFLPFVPTFYLLQDDGWGMSKALAYQGARYKNTTILYRRSSYGYDTFDWNGVELSEIRKCIKYSVREYPISDTSDISPNKYYRFMEMQGYLSHGEIGRLMPKWRCSLGLLLSFAYQMGYANIVLCGMDMESNTHFWNDPKYSYLYNNDQIRVPADQPINQFVDPKQIGTSVPEYVVSFANWARSRANVTVSVLSKRTVLYPDLPIYSFS